MHSFLIYKYKHAVCDADFVEFLWYIFSSQTCPKTLPILPCQFPHSIIGNDRLKSSHTTKLYTSNVFATFFTLTL